MDILFCSPKSRNRLVETFCYVHIEVLTKVRVFSVFCEQAITPMKRTAIVFTWELNKLFERPLNIPKCPSIENIGILYNYGPGVRDTNAQRLLVQSENTWTFVRTSLDNFILQTALKFNNIPISKL